MSNKSFFDALKSCSSPCGFFGSGSGGNGGGGTNSIYICQIANIIKKTDITPVDKINELKKVKEDIEKNNPYVTLPPCTCNQPTITGITPSCGCS